MSIYTVEVITERFPNSDITKIEGELIYKSIKRVEKALIKNTASIQSELGGGQHSYLGLVVSPIKYHSIIGYYFEAHLNLGALSEFPDNSTQP